MEIDQFITILLLLLWALCTMGLLYRLAKSRGRSVHWLWWGIHPLIGMFALLILYKKPPISTSPVVRSATPCPKCQSPNVVEALPNAVEIKKLDLPQFTILGYHTCQACGHIWERQAPLWAWYIGLIIGAGIFVAPFAYAWLVLSENKDSRPFGLGITLILGVIVIVGSIRGLMRASKASLR